METPPTDEQEAWLSNPEKRRLELLESLPLPIAERNFDSDIESAREDHNRYWAKRIVFEEAGWPDALDKQRLRARVREFEQALWDVWDSAQGAADEEEAEREFYRLATGSHAV